MIRAMNTKVRADEIGSTFHEKTTEPKFVAYTQCCGVLNVPSRMWMIRDWARRTGRHLKGSPQCLFHADRECPERRLCEVEWEIEEDAVPDLGDAHLRWVDGRRVIAAYHIGGPSTIDDTVSALEAWGRARGYRLTGSRCEVYHLHLTCPAGQPITEVQLFVDGLPAARG